MKLDYVNASGERVDIVGCTDNVDLANMQLGTYLGVLTASNGERVLGVFHNYVGYGRGKSILSSIQSECHDLKVYDTCRKRGGKQKIV